MRSALLLLPLLACAHAPAPAPEAPPPVSPAAPVAVAPSAAPTPSCVSGGLLPDSLFSEGNVVVLGEFHGTKESQLAAGDVVCQALLLGRRVVLVLEIPDEETARIDAFLAGGTREALLEGPFWRRDYQDGRSSAAMAGLIERARGLRAHGLPLSVVAMDTSQSTSDRDAYMAGRVVTAHEGAPQSVFVVLVGNIHSRTRLSLPQSMAYRVRKAGVPLTSVRLEYGAGAAWICDIGGVASCGEHTLEGRDRGPESFFEAEPAPASKGFDGYLYVGPMRVSPPAFSASGPPASSPASSPPPASPPRP